MAQTVYADGSDSLKKVNVQAAEMAALETQSEKGYAHLGWLLLEVAEMQYWRVRYETFRKYLDGVAHLSHKTTEQLLRYVNTVRDLSDIFTETQLETMGITKALKIRARKDYLIVVPTEIKFAALDPTVTAKALDKMMAKYLAVPDEKGDWMDCEFAGIVTPEKRALFEQAEKVARATEPVTKTTISESAQKLDVLEKYCMEFLGAHTGDGQ